MPGYHGKALSGWLQCTVSETDIHSHCGITVLLQNILKEEFLRSHLKHQPYPLPLLVSCNREYLGCSKTFTLNEVAIYLGGCVLFHSHWTSENKLHCLFLVNSLSHQGKLCPSKLEGVLKMQPKVFPSLWNINSCPYAPYLRSVRKLLICHSFCSFLCIWLFCFFSSTSVVQSAVGSFLAQLVSV